MVGIALKCLGRSNQSMPHEKESAIFCSFCVLKHGQICKFWLGAIHLIYTQAGWDGVCLVSMYWRPVFINDDVILHTGVKTDQKLYTY